MRAGIGMMKSSMMLGIINELKDKVVSLEQKVKDILPQADGLFAHVKLNPDLERKGIKRLGYDELKQVVLYVAGKANIELPVAKLSTVSIVPRLLLTICSNVKQWLCEESHTLRLSIVRN